MAWSWHDAVGEKLELCVCGRPEVLVRVVDEHERVSAQLVLGLVQPEAVTKLREDAVVPGESNGGGIGDSGGG